MNRIIAVAAVSLMAVSAYGQMKFTVKGKVPAGYPATVAAIGYEEAGKYVTDTVKIKNGIFEFRASVARPPLAQVTLLVPQPANATGRRRDDAEDDNQNMNKNIALFYPEGIIQVAFDTAGIATITGGGREQKAAAEYMAYQKKNFADKENGLPFERMHKEFIKKYPDAYISLDMMEMFAGVIQPAIFEPMFNALSERMRNTAKAKEWKKRLEIAKQFDVGRPSIDFTINDTQGKPVSLSSFKGRYVLLDFWASWCGPCRAGHPELINTYNKFKGERFEILAVSLDDKKEPWLKAIKEDKIPWLQVSDLKGTGSEVAKTYHINQIPQNLLIDPNGNIVGRNLTGESLNAKLAELLN